VGLPVMPAGWRLACHLSVAEERRVSQRCIEMVIGRLLTDEGFRETFVCDPHRALDELLERGMHLTHAEIAALVATDHNLWRRVAEQIDPRLQKVSVTSG